MAYVAGVFIGIGIGAAYEISKDDAAIFVIIGFMIAIWRTFFMKAES